MRAPAFLFSLLLLLATPVLAQEDLVETEWTVDDDGGVRVWPHPANDPDAHARRVARPMFELREGMDVLVSGGILTWLRLALPGPVDLASHCDLELHFRKLRLGLEDEDLVRRIATSPERQAEGEALLRRARLDRLLAVRLAAERGLRNAAPHLEALLRDPETDPFLRHAAWEALADFGDAPLPYPERRLPPLLPLLADIPDACDLVVVVNQARVPRWTGIAALGRRLGLAQGRSVLDAMGAAARPVVLRTGQLVVEQSGEVTYDLARRFGNQRSFRTVMAFVFDPELAGRHRVDGVFDLPRLRKGLRREGVEFEESGGALTVRAPGQDLAVTVGPGRTTLVHGRWPEGRGGTLLATELGLAGATYGEPVWIHLRRPVPPGLEPPLAGLVRGTLVLSFEGGIHAKLDAEYVHATAAKVAARTLGGFLDEIPERMGKLEREVTVRGPVLAARVGLAGDSAEEVLGRFLNLR